MKSITETRVGICQYMWPYKVSIKQQQDICF